MPELEKFNPYDEKYKKVEDLPEDQQQNFADVENGGFIKKEVIEHDEQISKGLEPEDKQKRIIEVSHGEAIDREAATEQVRDLLEAMPAVYGSNMWEDPRGLDEDHTTAELWKRVFDLNENAGVLLQNEAVSEEIKNKAAAEFEELLGKIDLQQIYKVPGIWTPFDWKYKKRLATIAHSAYGMMISYADTAYKLGLPEMTNKFLKNALKIDLLKETMWDYEDIIQREDEEAMFMLTMSEIGRQIQRVSDGQEIDKKYSLLDEYRGDKYACLNEHHKPGNKYTEETLKRFELPENMLKEAVNELVVEKLGESDFRLINLVSQDYIKYINPNQISSALEDQAKLLLEQPYNAYGLLNLAANISAKSEVVVNLAKEYINEKMTYELDSAIKVAQKFKLDNFLHDQTVLFIKDAFSEHADIPEGRKKSEDGYMEGEGAFEFLKNNIDNVEQLEKINVKSRFKAGHELSFNLLDIKKYIEKVGIKLEELESII